MSSFCLDFVFFAASLSRITRSQSKFAASLFGSGVAFSNMFSNECLMRQFFDVTWD